MSTNSPQIDFEQLYGLTEHHIHWLNESIGIHKLMLNAWQDMQQAAAQEGIEIEIVSGFRSFERQQTIWNNKFNGKAKVLDLDENIVNCNALTEIEKVNAILLYSALPGASRHHWGTDIDVFAPQFLTGEQQLQLQVWEYQSDGPFYPLTLWLNKHADKFGFYRPYDQYRQGVAQEPWHLSYRPLAKAFAKQHNVDTLSKVIAQHQLAGKECIIENLTAIYQQFIANVSPIEQQE